MLYYLERFRFERQSIRNLVSLNDLHLSSEFLKIVNKHILLYTKRPEQVTVSFQFLIKHTFNCIFKNLVEIEKSKRKWSIQQRYRFRISF